MHFIISSPLGAHVRFSYPSLVTRISSSMRTPPTSQYLSSTSVSMYLAWSGLLRKKPSMYSRQK